MRLYTAFFLFLLSFVAINIAFLDNLREIWGINYPIILLLINLDLLLLIVVFMVFSRKFVKTYLAGRKEPLRRKLSTSLMLYIIAPLIFFNLVTAIILLQSTKSFISGQLKEVARKSEGLALIIEEEEKSRAETYRKIFKSMKAKGFNAEDLKSLNIIEEVSADSNCKESTDKAALILCVEGYKLRIRREATVISLLEDVGKTAQELRNMVKARDIIGGVYVYFLVLAGFVSFLSAVWYGNLMARHISLPLERLSQRSREIAKGNFDVGIEVPQGKDEIQELAVSFQAMKEELKRLYERLKGEKETLTKLFNALPVGIVFYSREGDVFNNKAYEELSKKASVKESFIDLDVGRVIIYEDLEAAILAERFKTWQMAVKRIAHEIKNPLTPISLNLERLVMSLEKGQCQTENLLQTARVMLEELNRIKRILDQFRSLSVEVEPRFTELELGELIRHVARIYEDLKVNVDGSLRVLGDERLFRDMLFNLFNNSVEWGAKEVWIELGEEKIVYRDNGVGIEEGKEELIFLPYHSENPKGMGLGLAIVKHIAELHGWKVRAIPQEGGFYMVFELRARKGIT
ncbi:MAG: HAMP domain-containing protein [Aquificaceae bacterium]|nr:HAMP domain-containing protein [Aquificaceae bacterium]